MGSATKATERALFSNTVSQRACFLVVRCTPSVAIRLWMNSQQPGDHGTKRKAPSNNDAHHTIHTASGLLKNRKTPSKRSRSTAQHLHRRARIVASS